MLQHDDIIAALKFVIKLAFRRSKCKYIAIYNSGFSWINKPRNGTFVFEQDDLIK